MGFFDALSRGLERSREALNEVFYFGGEVDEDFWEDLEDTLVMGDMGAEIAIQVSDDLRDAAAKKNLKTAPHLRRALAEQLEQHFVPIERDPFSDTPSCVLFVGINGAGKTTLLRIIMEEIHADAGQVVLAKDKRIGYLAQYQDVQGHLSVYEELLSTKQYIIDMEERLRAMEVQMKNASGEELDRLMNSYTRLTHEFELENGYAYKSELMGVLNGLGFTEEDFTKQVATLSGGQKTRVALGKPEVGSIFLNAFQEGNNVIIQVGDDGAGIDVAAVRDKAIERGIITEEQAESMSQKDIINILFLPSFSMSKTITDISGRGVGLDVVKSNIEALGGDVEVKTAMGEGTTFTVRLPLTLAIIQALMVEVRDEKYAIALGSISNIEDIPVKDIKYVEAQEVIHLRGKVIPLVRLDNVLDLEPREEPESLTVVIVTKGDSMAGLVVDNLIGQQEIVIKSLGKYIDNNKLISGATILGDGEVALILDVNTLM